MKQFQECFLVVVMLVIVSTAGTALGDDVKDCEALHKPASCTSKDTPINYHVSTKCLSNTKVRITVQPPSENDLELITMQYSCYNGSEMYTHVFSSESEMLTETFILTDELFHHHGDKGSECQVTGCTKMTRNQCWQFILEPSIISCPEQPPELISAYSTASVQPQLESITSNAGASPVIPQSTQLHVTSPGTDPLLPYSTSIAVPVHSNEQSSLIHSPSSLTFQLLESMTSATSTASSSTISVFVTSSNAVNKPLDPTSIIANNSNVLPILISVGILMAFSFVFVILIIAFIGCKRVQKIRTTTFNHSDIEKIHDNQEIDQNIYMDDLNLHNLLNQEPYGSVLTLVQSLHLNKPVECNPSLNKPFSTLHYIPEAFKSTGNTVPKCKWNDYASTTPSNIPTSTLKDSVMNNSCPSLYPECSTLSTAIGQRKNSTSCRDIPSRTTSSCHGDNPEHIDNLDNDVFTDDEAMLSCDLSTQCNEPLTGQYYGPLPQGYRPCINSTTTDSTMCSFASSGYISSLLSRLPSDEQQEHANIYDQLATKSNT